MLSFRMYPDGYKEAGCPPQRMRLQDATRKASRGLGGQDANLAQAR